MAAEADAQELQPLRRAKDEDEALSSVAEIAENANRADRVTILRTLSARQEESVKNNKNEGSTVGVLRVLGLFRYATFNDTMILTVGLIFAAVHGASLPCLALFFGEMSNSLIMQFKKDGILPHPNEEDFSKHTTTLQENKSRRGTWSDDFGDLKGTTNMSRYSNYFIYIGIGALISAFIQSLCWETTCERLIYRMRRMYFAQLLRQDISWYDQKQSGELISKLSDDLERVREGIGIKFSLVLQYIAAFIAGFGVGFYANWRLTLVILGVSPLLIGASALLAKVNASSSAQEQLRYSLAGSIAEEVLTNIRTVAAFGGQLKASLGYEKRLDEGRILGTKKYWVVCPCFGAVYALTYITYGLVFWYGSHLFERGDASPGSVFTVFFGVMAGVFSIGNALPLVTAVSTALGASGPVVEVLDRKPEIDPYDKKGIKPEKIDGGIVFENVTFAYPIRPEIMVLKYFNAVIKPGQTIALVGSSGAGKSTVVSLLLRFYNFIHGKILLDGTDIRSLNLEWLRRQIGVVSQEPVLFGVSILDNIKYGYDDVSFNDLVHAAKLSNAHDFISSMPQGYDTLVGTSGAQLSGGQKQRIAIARALVRNPKILLLDEATSALDAQSEGEVQAALEQAMQGRTTIVIAHRLSTVRNADVIYVMKDGCVEEQGTHDELLSKQGHYHSLMQAQIFHDADEDNIFQDGNIASVANAEKNNQHEASSPSRAAIPVQGAKVTKKIDMESTFSLTGKDLHDGTQFWTAMFCVTAVVYGCGYSVSGVSLNTAAEFAVMRIRLKAFQNILNQAVGWFDMEFNSPGRLITRLARDAPLIRSLSGLRAGLMSSALITLATALIIAFCHGWKLAFFLLVGVPILLMASYQQMMILRRTQRRDFALMDEAGKIASESVQNIQTVQALGKEYLFVNLYVKKLIEPYNEAKIQAYIYSFIFSISQTVIYFMHAAAFSLGAHFIEIGDMEPADVYKVFFALTYCSLFAGQTAAYFQDLANAQMATTSMFQLMSRETDMSISPETGNNRKCDISKCSLPISKYTRCFSTERLKHNNR